MGLKDFDIPMPKSLCTVLGLELGFPLGFKFKLEGYYKYYFDRFYINTDDSSGKREYLVHSDGIGHAAGFDILIERKISKYIDGWICYSFIFARYLNPASDNLESKTTMQGEPTKTWYYPSYHRFHNLNIILNIRPRPWLTITPSLSFSTGIPKTDKGDIEMFAAELEDGTWAEMYARKQSYSDTLRTDFSIPFDLKIAFNCFFPKIKLRFEFYMAVEDLFVFLYSPNSNEKDFNKYTGEEQPSTAASYAMPIPIPSIGIKLNF